MTRYLGIFIDAPLPRSKKILLFIFKVQPISLSTLRQSMKILKFRAATHTLLVALEDSMVIPQLLKLFTCHIANNSLLMHFDSVIL